MTPDTGENADGNVRLTGGCQCGAVRYVATAEPAGTLICHCRMCQKAVGSAFSAAVRVPREAFRTTRGVIATFRSSEHAERGFCAACGTSLTINYFKSPVISVSLTTLDEPRRYSPSVQAGTESRLHWVTGLGSIKAMTTLEYFAGFEDDYRQIQAENHQHPDHDTDVWPPAQRRMRPRP